MVFFFFFLLSLLSIVVVDVVVPSCTLSVPTCTGVVSPQDHLELPSSLYSSDAIGAGQSAKDFFGRYSRTKNTHEMKIPFSKVGLIIGKGGETIKMLQNKTGAHIQVSKDTSSANERTVILGGTEDEIATAESEIRRIVEEVSFDHISYSCVVLLHPMTAKPVMPQPSLEIFNCDF